MSLNTPRSPDIGGSLVAIHARSCIWVLEILHTRQVSLSSIASLFRNITAGFELTTLCDTCQNIFKGKVDPSDGFKEFVSHYRTVADLCDTVARSCPVCKVVWEELWDALHNRCSWTDDGRLDTRTHTLMQKFGTQKEPSQNQKT
jgi:hypothetical protein